MIRALHRRRGSAAGGVIVVLVLALAAGALWYFVLRSTPQKTVGGLLEAARVGDEQMMLEYLTPQSRSEPGLVIGLTRRLAGEPAGEPQYSIGEPVVGETTATVPVEFPVGNTIATLTGMRTLTVPYVLHREGQTWLVDTAATQEEIGRRLTDSALEMLRRFIMSGGPIGSPDGRRI
ncbi:MAG: hypothetical protein ACOX9R_01660 [Armatimonadota bacterium]|jgi:hypothetical protein